MAATKPKTKRKYKHKRLHPAILKEAKPMTAKPTPVEMMRFLSKVTVDASGCWVWHGTINKRKGYPQFYFRGQNHWANRWSYQVFRGLLRRGRQAHHDKCKNVACVCPWHIEPETLLNNVKEMHVRRRAAKSKPLPTPPPGCDIPF